MIQVYFFAICMAFAAWGFAYSMASRDLRRYVDRRFDEYSRAIISGLREDED